MKSNYRFPNRATLNSFARDNIVMMFPHMGDRNTLTVKHFAYGGSYCDGKGHCKEIMRLDEYKFVYYGGYWKSMGNRNVKLDRGVLTRILTALNGGDYE